MVVLSLPSSLSNFEGRINHTAIAGCSETLVFVSPLGSDYCKAKINKCLKDVAENLTAISSPSVPKQGEAYIAKIGALFERAHIIRRPTPTRFQIYLIDQGFQDEVEYTDLFEYPSELFNIGVFVCICPVLVSSDELPKCNNTIVDRTCLCNVEGIARSLVVFGFVKGQLKLTDLDSAADMKHKLLDGKSTGSLDISTFDHKTVSNISSSESELIYSSNVNFSASGFDERMCHENDRIINGRIDFDGSFHRSGVGAISRNKQLGAFFKQRAFKEFYPDDLPVTINVRFEKMDRLYSTFWVVNSKIFTAVEQALRAGSSRFSRCPKLKAAEEDFFANTIPCVVRTWTDSPFKEFYRAVPVRFDRFRRRFSIFLVDFGWFKWVVDSDVYNISTLSSTDPIRSLPVALIHCQEGQSGSLHAADLVRGREYKMVIRRRGLKGIFAVSLYHCSEQSKLSQASEEVDRLPESQSKLNDLSSCKKLINDVCVQQLKVSLMMETLSTSPSAYHQSWMGIPGIYPSVSVVPFMPILSMPMIIPPQNGNITSTKDVLPSRVQPKEVEKSSSNKGSAQGCRLSNRWCDEKLQNLSPLKRHVSGFNQTRRCVHHNNWNKENFSSCIGNVQRNVSSSWELVGY
uniref:Tudor domain-containing protein n=1 Tax=Syphacia muris TaxID=451379 RepID=A0A0N5AQF1_9BILA